jgi:hypothetical protein
MGSSKDSRSYGSSTSSSNTSSAPLTQRQKDEQRVREIVDRQQDVWGITGDQLNKISPNPNWGKAQQGTAADAPAPIIQEPTYASSAKQDTKAISKYSKQQAEDIARIQAESDASIQRQLAAITAQTQAATAEFDSNLNSSMAASRQFNERTVAGFNAANAASFADVAHSQSQIATLTGPEKVAQISSEAEKVSGWEQLGKIGVNQGAIGINMATTRTGSNRSQQQSRTRQKVGIQGLRRGV